MAKKKYGVFGLRGELRKDVDIFGVFDFFLGSEGKILRVIP